MKKSVMALICLISVVFFASCKKDKNVENPKPTISIVERENFVADGDTINWGQTVRFGFRMASSSETHKNLKSLIITVDETEQANIVFPNGTDVYIYLDSVNFKTNKKIDHEKHVISATLTDVDGESAIASITLNIHVVEDPRPSISVIETYGFVADGDTVNLGQSAKFGFNMSSNNETKSELKSLTLWINDESLAEIDLTDNSFSYVDSIYFDAGKEIIGEVVIKATVSDVDGYRATASITLYINFDDPQLVETDFIWERRGAASATGLDEFGLEWKANFKDICAQIKPMAGYSLYEFPPEIWSAITTENGKAYFFLTAVEDFPSISVFNKVSVMDSHDNLDFVIGTINQETGETHLMHITRCNIEIISFGNQITITGQAK